ncbi:hypothetical protein GGR52DRAFT_293918 [Hypoxylon sp. FL1284]|nr:hypothetical protein GGR52DRAFT_293918 [Hypoxylon sp. FL1284]
MDEKQLQEQSPNIPGDIPSFPSAIGSNFKGHDESSSGTGQHYSRLGKFFRVFWLLTESNALTFVGPNTIFGLCGALSGPLMVEAKSGGDGEDYVTRNLIIAAAFGVYNTGSVKVAVGADTVRGGGGLFVGLSYEGIVWAAMVSVAIFTTMQVQDLQDVEGDRARGRRSAPIVMGDRLARWSVAVPMLVWPAAGAWFWGAGVALASPQIALGTLVAARCLWCSGMQADKLTWRLWCLWTAMLYTLPPLCYHMMA